MVATSRASRARPKTEAASSGTTRNSQDPCDVAHVTERCSCANNEVVCLIVPTLRENLCGMGFSSAFARKCFGIGQRWCVSFSFRFEAARRSRMRGLLRCSEGAALT